MDDASWLGPDAWTPLDALLGLRGPWRDALCEAETWTQTLSLVQPKTSSMVDGGWWMVEVSDPGAVEQAVGAHWARRETKQKLCVRRPL